MTLCADALDGRVDLGIGDAQLADLDAVERQGEVAHGRVAARAHVVEDPLDDLFGVQVLPERVADAGPHAGWQAPRCRAASCPAQRAAPRRPSATVANRLITPEAPIARAA